MSVFVARGGQKIRSPVTFGAEEFMSESLFREGGPYRIRRTGPNEHTFNITLPADEHGRVARQCPNSRCSPGYFKIKLGTGVEGITDTYCPYCRGHAESNDYATTEQVRFGKDIMLREAEKGIQDMFGKALGVGPSGSRTFGGGFLSIEMKYKPGPLSHVRHPFEEDIARVVVCPHCGLDHAVFGIAVWCADCGRDIFLTHVEAELAVITTMLSDIDRRRSELGPRVASRDLENCLEDVVSVFEAVIKALSIRHLRSNGSTDEDVQTYLKKAGTTFQSINRTTEFLSTQFGLCLKDAVSAQLLEGLKSTFEKRHPITHNLGVIDRKYIERGLSAESEGREIRVTRKEIESAIASTNTIMQFLHSRLIGAQNTENNVQEPSRYSVPAARPPSP